MSVAAVNPETVSRLIAEQRARDEIAAARDALKPSFDASCARAARIRAAREREERKNERIPSDSFESTRAEAFQAAGSAAETPAARAAGRVASRTREALAEFLDDSERETGMSMSVEEYSKTISKRETLRGMAEEICRRLKAGGIETHRADDYKLWLYWIHSKQWQELEQYRRICINPVVAAQTRAGILAALEYFCQENRYCRFWTFTTGERCPAAEIPGRLTEFFTRLRKLNHWMRKELDLEIVLRATEFGTLEFNDDDSDRAEKTASLIEWAANERGRVEPLYHPHFHCVIRSLIGYRKPPEWKAACEAVRAEWGLHVHMGDKGKSNVLQNPRELVKYVTKPGDLLKLTVPQLVEFYHATANRRLIRPMGALAKEIAARRAVGETLRRKRVGKVWRWHVVKDHNKTAAELVSPEDRAALDDIVDAEVFARECALSARHGPRLVETGDVTTLMHGEEPHREPGGFEWQGGEYIARAEKGAQCRVVAFIPPAAGPTRRKENRVIVMGNVRDAHAVASHPLVQQLWARTVESWEAGKVAAQFEASGEAADIFVHTGTLTVRQDSGPEPWRDPPPGVQLAFETA